MAESRESWFQRWKAGMNSAPGGKVDVGPNEVTASKVGRARPKPGKSSGSRVPGPEAAQQRKLGGIR